MALVERILDLWQHNPIVKQWSIALLLNSIIALLGLISSQKALTKSGVIHAWFLGVVVWGCLGWRGYAVVSAYFILGTSVTKIGLKQKTAKGIAEKRGGARGPENVWGSALTGLLCAIGYALTSDPIWWLGYVASFAAKLGDTTSSEVGKAYGQRTFLITTLEAVPAGTEGAISLEGSLAGIVAAAVLTGLAFGIATPWIQLNAWLWLSICWFAAVVANIIESWIGVVLQPYWTWLTNEWVNGIQTTVAALLAIGLSIGAGWILIP